jgi:hypothetical protein
MKMCNLMNKSINYFVQNFLKSLLSIIYYEKKTAICIILSIISFNFLFFVGWFPCKNKIMKCDAEPAEESESFIQIISEFHFYLPTNFFFFASS